MDRNKLKRKVVVLREDDLLYTLELGKALNANSECVIGLALSYAFNIDVSANYNSVINTRSSDSSLNTLSRQVYILLTDEQLSSLEQFIKDKMSKKYDDKKKNFTISLTSVVQAALYFFYHNYFKTKKSKVKFTWNDVPVVSRDKELQKKWRD